jgi:hypothetical protein
MPGQLETEGAMASSLRARRSAAVWSILKLLTAIALEIVSCVEAKLPIPPERIETMRAFERALEAECGVRTAEIARLPEVEEGANANALDEHACADFQD